MKVRVEGIVTNVNERNVKSFLDKKMSLVVGEGQYAIKTDAPMTETQVFSPFHYVDKLSGFTYHFFRGKVSAHYNGNPVTDKMLKYDYTYVTKGSDDYPLIPSVLSKITDFNLPVFDKKDLIETMLSNAAAEFEVASKILAEFADYILTQDGRIYIYPNSKTTAAALFDDEFPIWHELTERVAERLVYFFEPVASSAQRAEVIKFLYLELDKRTTSHVSNTAWVLFNNNIVVDTTPGAKVPVFAYDPRKHFFTRIVPVPYLADDALSKLNPSDSLWALINALSTRKGDPFSKDSQLVYKDTLAYAGMLMTEKKYDTTLFLTGSGGNGKSTYIKFLQKLITSSQVVSTQQLIDPSAYAALTGKRLLILEEINKLDKFTEGAIIDAYKNITGAETLSYRRLFSHDVEEVPHRIQFIITANHMVPGFYDTESTIRRFKVVNSERKVKDVVREMSYHVGESNTDVMASLETPVNLTWYANHAVRMWMLYQKPHPSYKEKYRASRTIEMMFEPDTSVFLANKHVLISNIIKGLTASKLIPNTYDFDMLRWDPKYLRAFVSKLIALTPDNFYITYCANKELKIDPDTIISTMQIVIDRVLVPHGSFQIKGTSIYDATTKIEIKNSNVLTAYNKASGKLTTPVELTYEVLSDYNTVKSWADLEARKLAIHTARNYHDKSVHDELVDLYYEAYTDITAILNDVEMDEIMIDDAE